MYVCLGKHTYIQKIMSGETYIPGRYVWGSIHTWKRRGVYVCLGKHTDLEKYRGMSGMYACLGKHTYLDKKGYVCMYVCLGKETYLEKKRYVCMYAWSKRTYLKSRGMYVCRRHRRVVHSHHVCMSGETYIPCMYVCMYVCRYVCMYVCMSGETYIPRKLQVCMVCMYIWIHVQHRRVCGQRVQVAAATLGPRQQGQRRAQKVWT